MGDPLSRVLGTTVARLAAARCGFSLGQEESARRYLDEARTAARRLGARRLLHEAATLGGSAASGRTPA